MPEYGSNNLWVGNNYSQGYGGANIRGMNQPRPAASWQSPYSIQGTIPFPDPSTVNNVLTVIGPESASEYKVGPNSQVVMMDSNRPVFYWKKSDDSGYSETKAYEYHEIPLFPNKVKDENLEGKYVTKEDFNSLQMDLMDIKKMVEDLVM